MTVIIRIYGRVALDGADADEIDLEELKSDIEYHLGEIDLDEANVDRKYSGVYMSFDVKDAPKRKKKKT